jgi:Kef-type K+ transport system membrane component KefB
VDTHQVAQLLLALAVIAFIARLAGVTAHWLGQPPVVGELTAGILIGPTFLPESITRMVFTNGIKVPLAGLANVALVLFMFCVGMTLEHSLLRGKGRVAASVSIGSIAVPFALGVLLALTIADGHQTTARWPFALFLGAAMSVTAFPVLARILSDRNMIRIRIGGLALASAAFDDVTAWLLLALVVAIAGISAGSQLMILLVVPYALVMLLVVRPLLRRLLTARQDNHGVTPGSMAIILIGLLISSYTTERIGIHFIFGAFLFGALMPREGFEAMRALVVDRIDSINVMFLLPVFFITSGMRVDLSKLDARGLVELGLILLVAISGKFVGAYASARVQGVDARTSAAVATLMNTRGLTEIVFVTVALQHGIIDHQLFSFLVVMALTTTAMTGPLLRWIYPRHMVERDLAELDASQPAPAEKQHLSV